jgi:hypothetical protein
MLLVRGYHKLILLNNLVVEHLINEPIKKHKTVYKDPFYNILNPIETCQAINPENHVIPDMEESNWALSLGMILVVEVNGILTPQQNLC